MSASMSNQQLDQAIEECGRELLQAQIDAHVLQQQLIGLETRDVIVDAQLTSSIATLNQPAMEKYAGDLGEIHREIMIVGTAYATQLNTVARLVEQVKQLKAQQDKAH